MNQLAEKTEKLYFIDLFAGAGGLSEGFIQAGFYPIAHVEMNVFAAKTLVTRSAYYYLRQAGKLSKYYDYMGGRISREAFWNRFPKVYRTRCYVKQCLTKVFQRSARKLMVS